MDQSGGVQSLPGLFLGHPLGGQPAQLVIDQRKQSLGSMGVALVYSIQDLRYFAHETEDNRQEEGGQAGQLKLISAKVEALSEGKWVPFGS